MTDNDKRVLAVKAATAYFEYVSKAKDHEYCRSGFMELINIAYDYMNTEETWNSTSEEISPYYPPHDVALKNKNHQASL